MTAVLHHLAAVCQSWLLLGLAALGWGHWIWRLAGRPPPWARGTWVWCSLAGFAAQALLLQGLVYAHLPLRWTAWPVCGLALAGVAGWVGTWRREPPVRPARREALGLVGAASAALLLQSASLLWVGPEDYYGKGRVDQANYVFAAQYLMEFPATAEAGAVGFAPWRLKGMEMQEQRLTQSVVHGMAAVLTGTDAQRSYGAVSVFFLGLLAVAVQGWLRPALAAPRWLAVLGGIWAAVTPAATTVQLEGFFSQTATLFVFPALAAVHWPGLLPGRARMVCSVPLLGFLAGAYTEFLPVGVALVASLAWGATGPWRGRVGDLLIVLAGALAINPGYLPRLGLFFLQQFKLAADAGYLRALVPDSGTWRGWGRLYFDLPSPAAVVAGWGVLALILAATVLLPTRRRRALIALLMVPLGFVTVLLVQPQLPVYAFAKLLLSLAPLGVALLAGGVGLLWRRSGRPGRGALAGLAGLGLLLSIATAAPQHGQVVRARIFPLDLLAGGMRAARQEAERHPERIYLVDHPHPLIGGWLCYFARRSAVYYDQYSLLDRVVPSEDYAFRKIPGTGRELWWLDPVKSGPVRDHEASCTLRVKDARAQAAAGGTAYVGGDKVVFLVNRAAVPAPLKEQWLDFTARPLAGSGRCTLELVDTAGERQRAIIDGPARVRFRLSLPGGESSWVLHVTIAGEADAVIGLIVLQNLSLESVGSPVYPNLTVARKAD